MEKGKRKWVRIIVPYTCLNETKKEARQVNQKLKRGNITPTCIKSTGDKIGVPDSWVIKRLGDRVTPVVPPTCLYCRSLRGVP